MVQLAETHDTALVGVSFAFEAQYGKLPGEFGLPGVPTWYVFEPNEISDDTGVEMGTAPRVTINSSGQREKGELVSLDGAAGLVADITQNNFKPLIPGHFSAPMVELGSQAVTAVAANKYMVADTTGFPVGALVKGFGFGQSGNNVVHPITVVVPNVSIEVTALVDEAVPPANAYIKVVGIQAATSDLEVDVVSHDFPALISTALDFTTLPLTSGQFVFIGDDNAARAMVNDENNGYKRIYYIAPHLMLLDKTDVAMVAEAANGSQVRIYFGDYVKNVNVAQRVKQTTQWETTLGVPDLDVPGQIQARYLTACDLNEIEFDFPIEDKCGLNLTFIAADERYLDGTTDPVAPKAGDRAAYVSEGAYNTASDEWGIRLSLIDTTGGGAPLDMAGAIEAMTVTISAGKELQKKQAQLPAFKNAQGVFEASAEITFYFSTLDAMRAARANSSCSLDVIMAKENAGFAIDFPYGSINSTPLNYSDLAIKQTTTFEASRGRRYNAAMDHTCLITWFAYLPNMAMPQDTGV